jgi:ABC-type sugar transport system permease subunit
MLRTHLRRRLLVIGALPAVAGIVLLVAYPVVRTVYLSLTSWDGASAPKFIGTTNFRDITGQGGDLWATVLRTIRFSLVATIGVMVIGTLLAAALSAGIPGARFFRVVWFLPMVVPVSVSGVYWVNAFQPTTGLSNYLLGKVGLGTTHAWLADPHAALYVTSFVWVWISTGFAMIIMLGAMNGVPVEIYEAAEMDGCSVLRRFFSITLPLVRPTLATVALLEIIFTFNGFTLIWAMTQGGPGTSTQILPVEVYRQAFINGNYGAASAQAVVGGVLLLLVSVVMTRFIRSSSGSGRARAGLFRRRANRSALAAGQGVK